MFKIFSRAKRVVKTLLRGYDMLQKIDSEIKTMRRELSDMQARLAIMQHELLPDRPLDEGERLVSPVLKHIWPDHIARYEFARTQLGDKDQVLDIACGIGYGSYILAKDSKRTIDGVEIDPKSVAYAKRYYQLPNIRFRMGNALALKTDVKYDAIVSFETLEHVKDGERVLQSFYKILKKGGTLILSTPDEDFLPLKTYPNPFHLRQYTFKELKALLEKTGFALREYYSHDWASKDLKKNTLGGHYVVYVLAKP